MLPDHLKEQAAAVSVDAFDGDAIKGGKLERGELTLEIAPGKIASVCGFLKYDQKFVRLSTVTRGGPLSGRTAFRNCLPPALHRAQ